jgi:hypothetical protein
VTIFPGDAVIVTAPVELTATVRSGASQPLCKPQAVVRLNPEPSNARATELVEYRRPHRQEQGDGGQGDKR